MTDQDSSEPPVIGGISAEPGDAAQRVRRKSAGRSAKKQQNSTGKATAGSGSDRPLAYSLLFLLVLVAAGAGVFWVTQLLERQDGRVAELSVSLKAVEAALAEISSDVSETGMSLTEVGSETDKQIRFLDSEVRKLWVVSNERNKKSIQEQETLLKKMDAKLTEARKQQDSNRAAISKLRKSLASANKTGKKATEQLSSLQKEFTALQLSVQQRESRVVEQELALQTRIDQVAAELRTMRSKLAELEQSSAALKEQGQSLDSINAFRKQTNQTLTTLQSVVNNLQHDMETMKRAY